MTTALGLSEWAYRRAKPRLRRRLIMQALSEKMGQRWWQHEIAIHLGVSEPTVHRVLGGHARWGPASLRVARWLVEQLEVDPRLMWPELTNHADWLMNA